MNTPVEKQQSSGFSSSTQNSSTARVTSKDLSAQNPSAKKGLRELFSSYKITALQDVTVCACVDEKPEWVNLQAGEVRHGVKTVLGVHPNDAPEHRAIHAFGATFVVTDTRGLPLPNDFYGVVRVEQEEREAA